MKLSTRSRYGVRAMLVLAMDKSGGAVMAKEIAEKQNLPGTYLEQLMLTLRKSGLVLATRGAHGGYMLAKPADQMTLAEIVEALEGEIDIADCADVPNCCLDANACALKDVFADANRGLRQVFESVSLAELASRQQIADASRSEMYYI